MKTYASILLALLYCFSSTAQPTITIASLLAEMTDFKAITRFPDPAYTLKQTSSYDRLSIAADQPGWFANRDFNHFMREEKKAGHSEFVMMDADGPGAIVRFWLTTQAKPGTLRIYFDNEPEASLQIPAFDLMKAGFNLGPALLNPHTSYEPQGKGGNTLYLPLLYQKHCKVTWQFADSANLGVSHYYQVNYRTYTKGTKVETFAMDQLRKYRSIINKTEAALWNPPLAAGVAVSHKWELAAGKAVSKPLPNGAAALRSLVLQLASANKEDRELLWHGVRLKIVFDGDTTVNCPLDDFIGSGYGAKPISSWYRELTPQGKLTSRWVMPYKNTATIVIENTCALAVSIHLSTAVSSYVWNDRSLYFHATHKYEENVRDVKWDYDVKKLASTDPSGPIDWNFVTLKGKGIYLGNTLSVNNHMNSWYGEGDAKAYVDKETFPSEFGTGLEDYYNTSWAPVILYNTPFANAPRADQPSSKGYNTFTRTRILDAIPFSTAFSFDTEMLAWETGVVDAAATTYWYGR